MIGDALGHLYLLKEREFVKTGEPVYKFGRTFDLMTRFSQYPKSSQLIYVASSADPVAHERCVLHALRLRFLNRRDIGAEYFEGDLYDILAVVQRHVRLLHRSSGYDVANASTQTSEQHEEDYRKGNARPFEKFRCAGR